MQPAQNRAYGIGPAALISARVPQRMCRRCATPTSQDRNQNPEHPSTWRARQQCLGRIRTRDPLLRSFPAGVNLRTPRSEAVRVARG